MKCKKLAILLSHPIQYFSPLFKILNSNDNYELIVYYCSDSSIRGVLDHQFGQKIKWDIPLLDGYEYKFLHNLSPVSSPNLRFFGLMNFGIIRSLIKDSPDVLLIHGWAYFTNILAIFVAKIAGIKVWMRCENPLNQELRNSTYKQKLKKLLLGKLLFRFVDKFLCIGTQNQMFYHHFGVQQNKLLYTPYAVDNDRFRSEKEIFANSITEIKQSLSIPISHTIILFSGKYIQKKRPIDVVIAFSKRSRTEVTLILMGEGELRIQIENYIKENNLKNILLTGFVNQSEISKFYSIADIFVLPSDIGETWGLVVNEAMNFAIPVIVSDIVGSAADLVIDGQNGFIYPVGDVNVLSQKLEILINSKELRNEFGKKSLEIIDKYSYQIIAENINFALND